ncbi:hypothetical protein ACX40Y_12340 [Sphingomonas sp. RS6]
MASFKRLSLILMTSCAGAALSACDGANDIASPGTGGNVIINNPTPAPTATPTPTPTTALVTPATGCPTIADPKGLTDEGTITGPTGTWRVCTLPAIISKSVTLPKIAGLLYQMKGRVDVGCDGGFTAPTSAAPRASSTVGCTTANGFTLNSSSQLTADTNVTLTIDPGVIVYGGTGTSWLAVNRGNKINAVGTASQPIIFTSRDNVLGINNDASFGQWGGVVLMGRARVTDCSTGTTAGNTCERATEGSADPAVFGGTDDTYNAGTMKYVQIRYSGYVLGANTELQALTTEGIGSGTTLDYIQSHNSSDDGAEFFGGVVNFKHYIATGADDDSLDIDTGLRGAFQYVLLIQRPGQGDALMEVDSNGFEADLPRQNTAVANFTAIQSQVSSNNEANDQASVLLRGNADLTLVNGLLISPNNECIRMNGSGTTPATLVARSVALQCNSTKFIGTGSITAAQVATAFGSGTNNNNDSFVNSLANLFVNGATETAVTATDPKTVNSFFDTTTWIGAVKDANDTWYAGWTCNSGYASFDNTSVAGRACTSLPTT